MEQNVNVLLVEMISQQYLSDFANLHLHNVLST